MKAHDVRQLRLCKGCGRIGWAPDMIQTDGNDWHGDCLFKLIGVKGLRKLPKSEIGKFRLNEIGVRAMKAICT